ncbi:MAG: hypothetical protein CSA33_02935 [Desulfobulbus propionicus]|nr:MAG: hypothetical protein CSA33_02935 [Desulfobulbus propionicus]
MLEPQPKKLPGSFLTDPCQHFLIAQTAPDSVSLGNLVYLGLCVAKVLPKRVGFGATIGGYFVAM